eukprot:TRINITY_DN10603_c1_g1_i1.p1 TRINITY_DN10603_c1_g1~~TRINITY_DN10603_c1_g1_i1.p1  ORF type:complete len:100 (-),score=4.13 TRINITY_DN10603_c1_g1_i1:28-327(-)
MKRGSNRPQEILLSRFQTGHCRVPRIKYSANKRDKCIFCGYTPYIINKKLLGLEGDAALLKKNYNLPASHRLMNSSTWKMKTKKIVLKATNWVVWLVSS